MMPQNRLVVLSEGHTGVCTQERERETQNVRYRIGQVMQMG